MLKAKDLHERSLEDLKELEKSLRGDTFQNRIKNFTNRLDDTSSMRKTRQDLARVLTVLAKKAPKAEAPVAAKPVAKAAKAKAAESKPAAEAKTTKSGKSSKSSKKGEAK